MVDHLIPNQVARILEFQREREGEVFCFQRLAKALIGADSRILKTHRLPPTKSPLAKKVEKIFSLNLKDASHGRLTSALSSAVMPVMLQLTTFPSN